ncbi:MULTISPECIES: hypothetical protein [unclassified Variovorax]|uniref:hypothetical protein n=1 Tax=unclassified Variovorax TaxID=663243 RepID=UPI000A3DDC99|nr:MULTISPECIES: hypothetical protein [unclassified Variovorax]PNG53181.1 hypothetical protein CHC06_04526 [Variovorax sp. B2]PNG53753.1 hypothetical protein CHC07_03573 [Variovorax sp. B4]VTV11204.1 hypothetical protein WDL1CHR_02087 [Variovorax sp. WDL1]
MPGQADSAPATVDDLASFLVENPEADQSGTSRRDAELDEQPDNSEIDENPDDEPEEDPDKPEDDPEDPEVDPEDEPEKGRQGLKFKVPVKGEDGADTTIEVDEKELIAGYQRHADYTRKTQELGNREREAVQAVSKRLDEGRNYYLQQATLAHDAIQQLAGLKSEAEMAQLAVTDKAAWIEESARSTAVKNVLQQLRYGMELEKNQAEQEARQQAEVSVQQAWGTLRKEGINSTADLGEIFKGIISKYGVPAERFKKITDPSLVLIMRDAMAFHELQNKAKTTVKQKVQNAPKLPPQRQSVPKGEKVNKAVSQRFKTGRAKVDDLAAFLSANNI